MKVIDLLVKTANGEEVPNKIEELIGKVEIIKDFNLFNEKSMHASNTKYKLIEKEEI